MRLDLKIQDKSLKEMRRVSSLVNRQEKFHFTKNGIFYNFCKDIAHIFLRVFPNFTVSTEGNLEPRPRKKFEFFLTLFNDWNFLVIVAESLTLDAVEVLDKPLVSEGYVLTKCLGESLCNSERN